jgi:hypothetical protein
VQQSRRVSELGPAAEGVRLHWAEVPQAVRDAFETWTGARVLEARSQANGFSPGVAARLRLRLSDERGIFVKAIGPEPNPDSPRFHRREARVVSALPPGVPVPRLRWFYDEDGWVLLAFDEIDGRHPLHPWRLEELQRVLDGLYDLAQRLTPSPLAAGTVRTAAERVERGISGWRQLRDEPLTGLDAWSQRHLPNLAELEAGAVEAVAGDTLLHFDVRADNMLFDNEDRVWFVDRPHACVGAAWFDVGGTSR